LGGGIGALWRLSPELVTGIPEFRNSPVVADLVRWCCR
jgi:hypothetical protein